MTTTNSCKKITLAEALDGLRVLEGGLFKQVHPLLEHLVRLLQLLDLLAQIVRRLLDEEQGSHERHPEHHLASFKGRYYRRENRVIQPQTFGTGPDAC